MVPCFLLERTFQERVFLRVYASIVGEDRSTPCTSTHDAVRSYIDAPEGEIDSVNRDDPLWPTHCDRCGYEFHPHEDNWQTFKLHLYEVVKSVDENYVRVGGIFHVHPNDVFAGAAPPGAMWYADWIIAQQEKWNPENPWWHFGAGPDGHALCARTPGGEWHLDARATNCTRPTDNTHRCWVRHGEAPYITVDKNGDTCAAGAGSIVSGSYHGFLRNGYFT